LVGRERELALMHARLADPGVRLLTLTGPGGTGKTRLGLQVAADALEKFEDGVYFVALAPLVDPALVASSVAQALGLGESGDRPLAETLVESLRDKQLLLVLDNFEQVLEGAPLVAQVLARCPQVKVLVTSRAALNLQGEYELAVPPLELPSRT